MDAIKETKKGKRTSKLLHKLHWLSLVHVIDVKGRHRYELNFYRRGNRNFTKTIAFTEKQALESWAALSSHLVPLATDLEKEQWINARVASLPKRNPNRAKEILLKFGTKLLARQLEEHCKEYLEILIERSSKTARVKLCRELANLAGVDEKLNNRIVLAFFKSRMAPENHDSPETLNGYRTDIKSIATSIGIRDIESLFHGLTIPTTAQLKDSGIAYNEKNRRHLERYEVRPFVKTMMALQNEKNKPIADAFVIQLISGPRPQEAPLAQLLDHAIFIEHTLKNGRKKTIKTARKGVEQISVRRTPIIDAILFLTDCNPKPFPEKDGIKFFREVASHAKIEGANSLDRYCLRHTPLTWLSRTLIPQVEIRDMAGHMSLRMLDEHYVRRTVKDQRSWEEAMPLNFDCIEHGWHGFLLECFMVAIWPSLEYGIKPKDDPRFQKVLEILSRTRIKRNKLSLFD